MTSKKKITSNNVTKEELIKSISNSGYLIESEIVKQLNDKGFFVDPNQCIKDKITGKSREIDIVAEYHDVKLHKEKVAVKTHFILEVKNNSFPVVLITERSFTPNMMFEDYQKYIVTPPFDDEADHFLHQIDLYEEKKWVNQQIYSQYCSFTLKKSNKELMAFHPDEFYDSFLKIIEHINTQTLMWDDTDYDDKYWRLFFYQPVLVIKNDLMVLKENQKNEYDLQPVDHAKLEFNYFQEDTPTSILIDVVTKDALLDLLYREIELDNKIESKIVRIKKQKDA